MSKKQRREVESVIYEYGGSLEFDEQGRPYETFWQKKPVKVYKRRSLQVEK